MKKLILIIFLFISFFAFFSICFCLEIPNILFSFQTPSYLIDKNTSLNEFYCDKTKPECKINFNLEGSFTGIYKSSNYICEISFGSGFITGEENKCNPNVVIFGTGIFDVTFKILEKNNLSNFKQQNIIIKNLEENSGSTNTGSTSSGIINSGSINTDIIEPLITTNSGVFLSTGSIINLTVSGASLSGVTFDGSGNILVYYGTGNYDFSGALLDSKFEFTDLQESTIYFYKLDLVDNDGAMLNFFTGSFKTESSSIYANFLSYFDVDNNKKVDKLEITFNKTLTGILDFDKIKIYSNTGGLATRKINTETGIISNYFISGSILGFELFEQDNEKINLSINNTTTSDLRLKSYSGIGITDLFGNQIEDITLTTSFDNYNLANIFNKINNNSGSIEELSGSIFLSGNLVNSGSINNYSGSSLSGTISNSGEILNIPEIILNFQQPSHIIQKNGSIDEYDCDKSKSECKINFNLEGSFTGSHKESNYICEISFGSGFITGEENKCNPGTITLSNGIHEMFFRIISKSNLLNFNEKRIVINNEINSISSGGVGSIEVLNIIKILPKAVITLQGTINGKTKKLEGNILSCFTNDICNVNFTAENTYNPDKIKITYFWNFGNGMTANKKNPAGIKYSIGEYKTTLKIMDDKGNFSEDIFYIKVIENIDLKKLDEEYKILLKSIIKTKNNLIKDISKINNNLKKTFKQNFKSKELFSFWNLPFGIRESEENIKLVENNYKVTNNTLLGKQDDTDQNELKELEEILSNKPVLDLNFEIYVQGKSSKNKTILDNIVYCKTYNKCSIDFGIKGKKNKNLVYLWDFGNGQTFSGFSPKAISYGFGKYTTFLSILDDKNEILLKKQYNVEIQKIPKKIVKKSVKKSKKIIKAKSIKKKDNSFFVKQETKKIDIKLQKDKLSTEQIVISGIGISFLILFLIYFLIKKYVV